jgi:peroxiredoxin
VAIPEIKALAAKYADKGLVVVGPSLDAEAQAKKLQVKHGITYPIVTSAEPTAEAYGVKYFPTMFLVDKNGKIVWKGHEKDEKFSKALEKALGQ